MAGEYNPNSSDAQFATILQRLHQQDRNVAEKHEANQRVLEKILRQTEKTNGRVTRLEQARKYFLGWVAGSSVICGVIWQFLTRLLVVFLLAVPSLQAAKPQPLRSPVSVLRSLPNDCVIIAFEKERSVIATARLHRAKVWARVLAVRAAGYKMGHALCVFQPGRNVCVYDGAAGTRELPLQSHDPLTIARAYYETQGLQITTAHFYE